MNDKQGKKRIEQGVPILFIFALLVPVIASSGLTYLPLFSEEGVWIEITDDNYTGGSALFSNTNLSRLTYMVNDSVVIINDSVINLTTQYRDDFGILNVYLDDILTKKIDTYSQVTQFQVNIPIKLNEFTQNLSFEVSGEKNAASSGIYIVVDEVISNAHRFNDANSSSDTPKKKDEKRDAQISAQTIGLQGAIGQTGDISFVNPTPANGFTQTSTYVKLNVSISSPNIKDVIFNWNESNYSLFNDSLVLMYNFDNVSALGENYNATGATIVDVSNGKNNGSITNMTAWNSTAAYGGALFFDGIKDYVVVGNNANLEITGDLSIGMWIRPVNWGTGVPTLISKRDSFATMDWEFFYAIGAVGSCNNELCFWWGNSGAFTTLDLLNGVPTLNEWNHILLTRAGNAWTLYIDGISKGTQTTAGAMPTGDTVRIGYLGGGSSDDDFFNGSIDEVRLWNRSIGSSEAYQLYASNLNKYNTTQWYLYVNQSKNATMGLDNGTYSYQASATDTTGNANSTEERTITIQTDFSPPNIEFVLPTLANATSQKNTYVEINVSIDEESLDQVDFNWNGTNYSIFNDSLVLMYNFDNVSVLGESETFTVDVSGNGINGTASNGSAINSNGRYGLGANFDGVDDQINLATTFNLGNGNFTTALWVNLDSASESGAFVKIGDSVTGFGLGVGASTFDGNGNDLIMLYESNRWIDTNVVIGTGWHHVAMVVNNIGDPTAYIDGVRVYNDTGQLDGLVPAGSVTTIGGYTSSAPTSRHVDAVIDEVRIWNRSLSNDEIVQHYFSNLLKYNLTHWYLYVNQSNNATASLSDGIYSYQAFAKDRFENAGNVELRTVDIDNLNPSITIDSPSNATNSSDTGLHINYSVSDRNLQSCWYSNDTLLQNTTLAGCANITTITWSEGKHNVTIWANDSAGNVNSSSIAFTIDTLPPAWSNNNTNISSLSASGQSVMFNITLSDENPHQYVFGWYNGSLWANDTAKGYRTGQNVNVTKNLTISSGTISWTWYFNDTAANSNQSDVWNVILGQDITFPIITYVPPTPAQDFNQSLLYVELNFSLIESNLDKVIYTWNRTNYTLYNDSLILRLNMDNHSSLGENDTHVFDVSNNANGTVFGGAVWNASGRYGGAFQFDGTNDYIQVSGLLGRPVDATLCAWAILNARDTAGAELISVGDSIAIRLDDSTYGVTGFYKNATEWPNTPTSKNFTGTGWHFYCYSYDDAANVQKLYIDGNMTTSTAFSGSIVYDSGANTLIGKHGNNGGNQDFNGMIDEVAIWNRSLTEEEISQLYLSNLNKFNATEWYLYVNQSHNATVPLSDGIYTYQVFGKDTTENPNNTQTRRVSIDTLSPVITINSPVNATNSSDISLDINYSVSDRNLQSCWYSNDTLRQNTTLAGCANITTITWSEGKHNVTIWANDSAGNVNSSSVAFTIDTLPPAWSNNNTNFSNTAKSGHTVLFNITLSDANPHQYVFGWYNGSLWTNDTARAYSDGQNVNVTKNLTLSTGNFNWTWYFNDTAGNSNQSHIWSMSLTEDIIPPVFNSVTNQTLAVNTPFAQTIVATDANGISCYSINDTANFQINCSGYLINNTVLSLKVYHLNITANDSNGNKASLTMWVNVTNLDIPGISFIGESARSGEIPLRQIYIPINVSFTGTNVSINVYNATKSVINSTNSTISPLFFNITNLSAGVYYFNATTYNSVGKNETPTFSVMVGVDAQASTVKSQVKIAENLNGFGQLPFSAQFGNSLTGIGDLDLDGIQDIAVASAGDRALYILFMNASGNVKSSTKIKNGLLGFNDQNLVDGHFFGLSIENIGDIDGDGVVDIAVGAVGDSYNNAAEGAIFIFNLNRTGGVKNYYRITGSTSGFFPDGLGPYDSFGSAIAQIGDVDNDGVNDLAVGAYLDENTESGEGAVYVLFMKPDGTVKSNVKISDGLNGFFPSGLDANDKLGGSVDGLGDLDNDGIPDIAVGAPYDENGDTSEGAIYIMFLNRNGTVKNSLKISDGLNGFYPSGLGSGDNFGGAIEAVGDLNADGIMDIAVGARNDENSVSSEGAFYILYLNETGGVKSNEKIAHGLNGMVKSSPDSVIQFGSDIASIGDLDADGVSDLIVGAHFDRNGGDRSEGAIYVLFMAAGQDRVAPLINFGADTSLSKNYSQSFIKAEIIATDENLHTVTLNIYNFTGLVKNISSSTTFKTVVSPLSNGVYWINATANDSSGNNASTATRMIVLDTKPPAILPVSPGDRFNTTLSSLNFTVNSTDETNVSCTLFMDSASSLGNVSIATNRSVESRGNTTLNASGLQNRTYAWHFNCTDAAGNSNITATRFLTVDSIKPEIMITAPTQDSVAGYEVYIYTDISDTGVGIDNASYQLLNSSNITQIIGNGSLNASSNWDTIWNSSRFADTEFNITLVVTANDTLGNTHSVNNTFTLDNVNPAIQLIFPSPEKEHYNRNFSLNVIIQDTTLNYTNFSIKGNSLISSNTSSFAANTTYHTWDDAFDISSLADGSYNLTVFGSDVADNKKEVSLAFIIDTTRPDVVQNYPNAGLKTSAQELMFNWTPLDSYSVSMKCNLTINNIIAARDQTCFNNTVCSKTVGGLIWSDYVWNVSCQDNATNRNIGAGRSLIPGWEDDDGDDTHNAVDNLIGDETNVTKIGPRSLDIFVGSQTTLTSFNDTQNVFFYENSLLIVNFTHNFSKKRLEMSNFSIKMNATYILINHSGQLSENKTMYLDDDAFTTLCVKDIEIDNISDMSNDCSGLGEIDFVDCLGNNTGVTIDGVTCTDTGSRIRVDNLAFSAISATNTGGASISDTTAPASESQTSLLGKIASGYAGYGNNNADAPVSGTDQPSQKSDDGSGNNQMGDGKQSDANNQYSKSPVRQVPGVIIKPDHEMEVMLILIFVLSIIMLSRGKKAPKPPSNLRRNRQRKKK